MRARQETNIRRRKRRMACMMLCAREFEDEFLEGAVISLDRVRIVWAKRFNSVWAERQCLTINDRFITTVKSCS